MTTDTLSESIRYALLDIPKLDEENGGSLSQLICVRIYTHDRHEKPYFFPTYRVMMKESYVYEYILTLLSRDDYVYRVDILRLKSTPTDLMIWDTQTAKIVYGDLVYIRKITAQQQNEHVKEPYDICKTCDGIDKKEMGSKLPSYEMLPPESLCVCIV